jgi:hypothetical protein
MCKELLEKHIVMPIQVWMDRFERRIDWKDADHVFGVIIQCVGDNLEHVSRSHTRSWHNSNLLALQRM